MLDVDTVEAFDKKTVRVSLRDGTQDDVAVSLEPAETEKLAEAMRRACLPAPPLLTPPSRDRSR